MNERKCARPPESLLANLLEIGTIVACIIIALGLLLSSVAEIDGAFGSAVMKAGIALIILLPILRVVMMLGLFTRERDRRYMAISFAVLIIIGCGFVIGLHV